MSLTLAAAAPFAPMMPIAGFSTDGAGAHVLGATWPPGASFYFEDWVVDAAGPLGLSATNGLSGTTP
ncbi:MAG: hypothetical protein ACYTCU_05475 [Planctomycetota bacterium]|jgi:hypothetical protein